MLYFRNYGIPSAHCLFKHVSGPPIKDLGDKGGNYVLNLKEGRARKVLFHFVYQNDNKMYDFIPIDVWKTFKMPIAHAIDAREILPSRTDQT